MPRRGGRGTPWMVPCPTQPPPPFPPPPCSIAPGSPDLWGTQEAITTTAPPPSLGWPRPFGPERAWSGRGDHTLPLGKGGVASPAGPAPSPWLGPLWTGSPSQCSQCPSPLQTVYPGVRAPSHLPPVPGEKPGVRDRAPPAPKSGERTQVPGSPLASPFGVASRDGEGGFGSGRVFPSENGKTRWRPRGVRVFPDLLGEGAVEAELGSSRGCQRKTPKEPSGLSALGWGR